MLETDNLFQEIAAQPTIPPSQSLGLLSLVEHQTKEMVCV